MEKLNSAQQGVPSKQRQFSPVSAPIRPSPSNSPVPGFNAFIGKSGESLRPFGEQLFSGGLVPFSASADMPVPNDYVVGAGDTIELRLFGKENKTYQLTVDRTGAVTLPGMGPVSVAGMSYEMVGKTLLEQIGKHKIGVEATVSMGALRSIQIFLMGEVNNPAGYATDALTTVVNALLIGGGIKPTGSMRKIEIRRNGAVVGRVDLYEAMLHGGSKGNIRLQSGDTIFVPTVGRRVGVAGEILRPAIYELAAERTAEDLINLGGGLLPTAYAAQAKLDRVGQDGNRLALDVPLNSAAQRRLELRDGDVLSIPSIVARWDKSVSLTGSVDRAGTYEWKQGMQLSSLIRSFDSLARDAFRPLAIVERVDMASGTRRFHTVNLLNVIDGKSLEPLQAGDRIIVLSQADVEFLSSANVQFVLTGRLPPDDNSANAVAVQDKDELQTVAGTSNARKIAQGDTLDSVKATVVRPVQVKCAGLIELSNVIRGEGSERFRAAIMSSGQGTDSQRLVKNSGCPVLFQQTPELLTFVLENAITVRGEVKQPGVLPIPEGLPLDVAINARGGMTREAEKTGVELSRLVAGKQGRMALKRHLVKLDELAQVQLEPGNLVLVRKRFSEMDTGVVRMSGEFGHPGNFEIRRGEKLSELIARAGGLTPQAYPLGTVYLRQSVKEEKKFFYQKAALDLQNGLLLAMTRQRASGSTVDAGAGAVVMNLVNQMRSIDPVGRMVVEADPTVLEVRQELDVTVEPGDEIHVPRRSSSILVMGEVLNPGAVQFLAGKKAADYIAATGGTTQLADENRIFAIFPNGSAEPLKVSSWNFQPTLLPPGSTIYVSRDSLPTTSMDLMLLSLQVLKDLALSAASLAVINR
ncbi:SLBB domain-containing protein [Propionivibrio sp.]|uniref:SLBB domain-containing protein n=1 Tax=Propionivibrio sp. TaxID=2212460 RepID=UPI003BF443D9